MDFIWQLIVWAIFGFLAGIIAKWIMPGKDPGGIFVTILIGIVGAIIGGFIGDVIGFNDGGIPSTLKEAFTNWKVWITSIVGALIVLFVWKKAIAPALNK